MTVKYNGTGSISFNRVLFPYNYKITSSGFDWEAGSGTITSDVALDKVVFTVYHPDNTVKTYTKSNIGAKSLSMESVSSLIKFSAISTAGEGYFQIAATDILGRTLAAGRIFTASKSSGYSDSSDLPESFYYRINVTYTDPVLTDTAVYNGSTYQLYKASYTWNEAKAYAESIGGHLATITSSAENTAIYNMVKKRDVGAWIGCTSASGSWKWVTGEPWTYSNWRSGDPNNQWGQEFYGAMRITEGAWLDSCSTNANWGFFVVEFDPAKVERIVLEGESAPMVGDQFTLTANVLPYNATLKTVKCTSTNTAIATVDATTGLVKAVGEGTCNIVATAQDGSGVTGIFTVHVQPKAIPVTGITLKASSELYSSSNTITVKVGESFEVWAEITPSNADNTMAEFYTTDISIAEVGDYSNAVTAIAPGKCKIVAVSDENSEITHSLELVVTEDGGVEITNLSCAEGDVYQGTDIPLEGVVRVTGGATQLTYLELMLTNLDTGSEEYFDIDLYNAQPTEYDLSTLDFSNTANPKNLEPAEYDLMIKAWYMTANGDEEYKTTYVSFRVLEKQGETPEPGDVGELTYSNLKQPEGAVIQQGDVIPMSGTVSVTGGAKYLSAIRTTLYKVAGSDGNGEEYLVKYGNLYSDLSDTKPTRYELASEIEWYDTTYDEPGTYFIIMEIAFIGGNGEEIWDGFMPSGRFTIEGKDPGTVTVTGIQSPSGYFTEGTDYPLAGTLKVEGGAQYITSVYACVHNYDEYFETYEADYAGTKPTRLDISQLSFVEKLNIRNLVPGEYFLYMDVSYIDANGELNNRIIINDKVTILSKTPVNPGTITVEDLSYPSGEVVEGTIWPLNGVIKVKDGAQYIACIYGELYKNGTLLEALETDWLLEEEVAIYNLDKLGFSFRVSPDELKIGEYSLRVWVDFIDASGEWISYGDIVDTRYTIIADPDPTPYPGGIKVTNFGIEQQEVYPGQPMPLTGTISVADGAKEIQEVWFGVYQNGSWVDDFQYSLNNGTTSIELSAAHDVATKANPADREPGDYEFSLLFVRYIGSNGEEYTIDDLHGVIAGFDYIVEDVGYGDGPTPTPTPGGTGLKGDAYEDGIINVADAMIIRQHIAGYSVPINMANADVNGDNIVNVADAMMIRQFIAYGTVFP